VWRAGETGWCRWPSDIPRLSATWLRRRRAIVRNQTQSGVSNYQLPFNIEGSFFALDNACTHEEGPLAEGDIEGHEVTCPWHGARFVIRTGEVLCAPAYDVTRYNVRVTGADIEVEV
jgi:nitrite reductase/ring-hydroxylating ferredoxin subunit